MSRNRQEGGVKELPVVDPSTMPATGGNHFSLQETKQPGNKHGTETGHDLETTGNEN